MLSSDLAASLPTSVERVPVQGDSVPPFDEPIHRSEGRAPATIDPPLDKHGRGVYVSNVCAPMASKKSFHSRIHAWGKKPSAQCLPFACRTRLTQHESAPNAAEQDAAAREALADFDALSEADRRAAEQFGPDSAAPAMVWCYLHHSKEQLEALFRHGRGVIIVSPKACPALLRAVRDMGPHANIDKFYVGEVKALSQLSHLNS